ncbi:MAG: PAS domain S-box protein [Chloroflexi bacterium]|nr:PAS domain S-box protein [Chloroflexota bacterium]
MEKKEKSNFITSNKIIVSGIILALFFWFFESAADAFIFHKGDFVSRLFTLSTHEIWLRALVIVLLIGLSVYAQGIFKERKARVKALEDVYLELDQIFDTVADGMRVIDRDFKVMKANREIAQLAGVRVEEITQKKCYEVFAGDRCHTPECPMEQIKGGKERVEYEIERTDVRGNRIPCIVVATPFRDSDGNLIGIVEDFKNIASRKLAEDALRKSEEWLSTTLNSIGDAVISVDLKGNVTFMNPVAESLTGWKKEEAAGRHVDEIFNIIVEETGEPAENPINVALREKKATSFANHTILLSREGEDIYIDDSAAPIIHENGDMIGVVMVFRDITEKKIAEREIRRSKDYAELIFHLNPYASFTVDKERRITAWNKKAAGVTGYSVEEMMGHKCTLFAEDSCKDFCGLFSPEVDKPIVGSECVIRTRDGSLKIISKNADFLRDENGEIIGGIESFEDITEKKRTEQSLVDYQKELTYRNRIADIFLTTSDENLYNEVLKVVLESMDSRFGLFGFIDEKGDFVCPSLTSEIWGICNMPEKDIVFHREKWGGIWGKALIEKKTYCRNEALNVPEGHVSLSRALIVPIIYHDNLIGLIAVADKPSDYDEKDRILLESLVHKIAPVLHARLEGEKQDKERRRVEQALLESEEKYRLLFASMNEGVVLHEILYNADRKPIDYIITDVNPASKSILGIKPSEAIGKKATELYSVEPAPYIEIYSKVAETGEPAAFETYFQPMEKYFNISVFSPGKGRFATIFSDITERRKAEEALRQSEEKFRILFDGSGDAIFIHDLAGRVLEINDTAIKRLGYNREEFLKMTVADIDTKEFAGKVMGRLEVLKRSGSAVFEAAHVTKDGRVFPVEINSRMIEYDGKPAILSGARDITERKEAEHELIMITEELARSNRELENFAYVASHDLQEPLRMVSSFVQLLARRYQGKLDKEADEFISYVVDGAGRMQEMINDLLAYSRIGTRGRPFEPVDLNDVLEAVLRNLKVAIEERHAVIKSDPLPVVTADVSQMRQLFQNLVGNAIKFNKKEPPEVGVSVGDLGDRWQFAVKDNGIGIEPEYRERIFSLFQRLHGREEYPGTGLGLAISKKIVERHGGNIWVESAQGKGSTFYFTIPKNERKADDQ